MKCRVCGSTENLYKDRHYYLSGTNTKVQEYLCRQCNTIKVRKYRQRKNGKISIKKAIKKYEDKNPQRRKAWSKARRIKLLPCEICGSVLNIHRHHPEVDSPLEVVFLCALHHKQLHNNLTGNRV